MTGFDRDLTANTVDSLIRVPVAAAISVILRRDICAGQQLYPIRDSRTWFSLVCHLVLVIQSGVIDAGSHP